MHDCNALVTQNVGIVYAVLERWGWQVRSEKASGGEYEEAVAVAKLALVEAASEYDEARGRFSTLAWSRVHWALVVWMRGRKKLLARESSDDAFEAHAADDTEQSAFDSETRSRVDACLTALPRGERSKLHQCAALLVSGCTGAEVAARLKVSERTVDRMRAKLRSALWELAPEKRKRS